MSENDNINNGLELDATGRSLPFALLRARERVMDHFRPMLQHHGVTEQQWRVLRVLEESPDTDMGALAEAANILSPSLSRMAKGLETRGLIAMRRDPKDARRSSLVLTDAGRQLIATVAPESAAIRATIEAKVGRDRIDALLDQLDALLGDLS